MTQNVSPVPSAHSKNFSMKQLPIAPSSQFGKNLPQCLTGIHRAAARLGAQLLLICLALLGANSADGAALPSNFSETNIPGPTGGAWNEAVGILFDETGRTYVWERQGRVWIREHGASTWSLLIDIAEEVGGWRDFGLLGFALDPNFSLNGRLYLLYVVDRHHLMNHGTASYNPSVNQYYSATIGRITRYTARSSDGFRSVDMNSRQVLLGETKETGIPILHESHGVGSLAFGTDGTLLASTGDGASYSSTDIGSAAETYFAQALTDGIIKPKENIGAYRSQLVDSFNGKILRLDPATGDGIPSNPFYDAANPRSARSRVWALGLRNPSRFAFKPGTGSHNRNDANPGTLLIGDVGWNNWEDLHVCDRPGQNFGWPAFEGLNVHSSYYNSNVQNLDAPNPLYPGSGCTQYFYFRDLIKQDTQVVANKPPFNNPCNPSQKIPSNIPQFLHTRPVIDWRHGTAEARVPLFAANGSATQSTLGTAGCPVTGPSFAGNCAIGGTWYSGTDFPAEYRNTFFSADYGAQWIKNFVFDAGGSLTEVRGFATGAGGVVAMATHPFDGGIYYISWSTTLRRIAYSFSGNLPPKAVASVNQHYGPGPLTVQFTGSGSTDPENLPLTYLWNFGDGSPTSSSANPSHTFNASAGVPTKYTVTLTVTDNAAQTDSTSLLISVNNTPPSVAITSPVNGAKYPMTGDTLYNLTAAVSDAEFSDGQLQYAWQTILRHNNHEHDEPIDSNHTTTTVISPVGCDGNLYFYRIVLTVTDPAGLSASDEVRLYPDCPNQPPFAYFTASPASGYAPLLVSFDGRASEDPDGDALTHSWNFGDGSTGSGETPSHTYDNVGNYTVTLTVTDTGGLSHFTTRTISVTPAPEEIPPPWQHQDVGSVGLVGGTTYAGGTFTVQGGGADIWNNADAFHYVHQSWTGDGQILARVNSLVNTDPWAKAGVMFRESLAAGSRHVMMVVTPGNGSAFQRRTTTGGTSTHTAGAAVSAPYWVRLTRINNTFTGQISADGVTWMTVSSEIITLPGTVYVGLALTAHNNSLLSTAAFSGVQVNAGAAPTVVLTSPANGATFTFPASVNLSATVTANGNTINKVEFLRGSTVLGEDASAPYTFVWNNPGAGTYSLASRLVYNGGATLSSAPVGITIERGTPTLNWPNPSPITYGTALGAAQLNATADVAGTFSYNPPVGTVLNVGNGHTLDATFTPQDAQNYKPAMATANLNVSPAPLSIVAHDKQKTQGAPNPPLTGLLVGVQNGDNLTASYSTSANEASEPGHYDILTSLHDPDGRLVNYTVTQQSGVLTILEVPRLGGITESPEGVLTLEWRVHPGRTYRFQVKHQLSDYEWITVGADTLADSPILAVDDSPETDQHRFYRLLDVTAP